MEIRNSVYGLFGLQTGAYNKLSPQTGGWLYDAESTEL
jgi:hypothetical protein